MLPERVQAAPRDDGSTEAGDRDLIVGGDVGVGVCLTRVDVNVLDLTWVTFNPAFTVVVVKLLVEVLLTVETSDLRCEADLTGRIRAAVDCFHANVVVARGNRDHVVTVHNSLIDVGKRNEEQATVRWIERKISSTAIATNSVLTSITVYRVEASTSNWFIKYTMS